MTVASTDPHAVSATDRALAFIRSERQQLAVAVVYSLAIGLLSLVLPVTVQALVNTVAFGSVLQPVVILTILVSAALLASAGLVVLRFIALEQMQRRIFAGNASEVLDSLLRFRSDALEGAHAPELVNRFLDVATVQKSVSVLVIDGLTVVMQTTIGVCLLAAYHPYLLVFDVVLVAGIAVILFAMGRGAVRTAIEESRAKYDVVAWLQDVATHSPGLRSSSGASFAVTRANTLVSDYLHQRSRHFRVLLRQVAGAQILQALAMSSLLGIGGYLVIAGQLTLGQLVAAELVTGIAVSSFAKFGKSLETYYDFQAALDKLAHLTELSLERIGGDVTTNAGSAALSCANLSFSYDARNTILRDVSFDAPPGAKIAVHGFGAAGKSTLLDLLYGLREPDSGRILLDGLDYQHIRKENLRDQVFLLRGTEILPGSVLDNVLLGSDASLEEVRTALTRAGIVNAIDSLPEGLRTELTASGRPLSPSQAARLTFARAFVHKPHLLLIDEALDSIDDLRLDGELVRTLFARNAPWTLIVATERDELWRFCDDVYALESGELQHRTA